MRRIALVCSSLFILAATLMFIGGVQIVLLLGTVLCFSAGLVAILGRNKGVGLKPSIVLLVGALFCLFLNCYYIAKIKPVEDLSGKTLTFCCRVTEEPGMNDSYVRLNCATEGNNGFDEEIIGSVNLILYISSSDEEYNAQEGDILRVTAEFSKIAESAEKYRYSEGVFIDANVLSAEIIGHEETVYSRCVDIRRSVRDCIGVYTEGDDAAVLEGLLLGGTYSMSDELYSQFKACGASHITAVSGMHIGAMCMMVRYLLMMFMKRRKASVFTLMPLWFVVMLAGMTPSAVRAGIMCSIMLISECVLKKTDALNSLGIAIAAMLFYNPFYVCSLSFQLSCSATAGVIIISPYSGRVSQKIIRFEISVITTVLRQAITIFIQSIGAVLCTLPFQIIELGYVSLVAPIASVLICSAAVYAMLSATLGVALHFLPFVDVLASIVFLMPELLAKYIRVVVGLLSKVPFSYIPFGSNAMILWLGCSMALVAIWYMVGRFGGKITVSIMVTALLLTTLWTNNIFGKQTVEVAVLECGNGLLVAVTFEDDCVIIGCGDSNSDRYAIRRYMAERGIKDVEMLFLPSNSKVCYGGFSGVYDELKPEKVVIPENFGESLVQSGGTTVAYDRESFMVAEGRLKIETVLHENGCVYNITAEGKRILVGSSVYDATELGIEAPDLVITSRALPKNTECDFTVVASKDDVSKYIEHGKAVTNNKGAVWIKYKQDKGLTVYGG